MLGDRVMAGCYGAIPRSQAVACLLDYLPPTVRDTPLPEVGGPGATQEPPRKPSLLTRCKRHMRRARYVWTDNLPFPNPLQSIALALWITVCFLFSGSERLGAPVYSAVRAYGGNALGGLSFLAITIGLFVGWRWMHRGLFLAYFAAATAYALFAIAVGKAASEDPTVSWIATGMFGWLAWVHARAASQVSGEWRWVTRRHE